jgi:hypothetical protein
VKCAYFAFDRNAVNTKKFKTDNISSVDYFLIKNEEPIINEGIEELDLMASHLCFSQNDRLQTEFQKKYLKNISHILSDFKANIYDSKISKIQQTISEFEQKTLDFHIHSIEELLYIKWDKSINKFCVENNDKNINEYDFIFIENNQFVMSALADKQENLFFTMTEQTHFMFNFEFEVKWKHKNQSLEKSFLLICDEEVKSVIDNCYFVKYSRNKLNCLFYAPIAGLNNEDYFKFLLKKIENDLCRKIFSIQKLDFINFSQRPADGFYKFKAQLRNSKNSTLIPSYFLWNQQERDAHLLSLCKSKGILNLSKRNLKGP